MTGARMRLVGSDAALAALGAIAARAEHPRPMWADIGASLVTSTQRRFETETGPDGQVWPPSLRALAEGGKTLTLSGRLKNSVAFQESDTGVEVGTNVLYAAIHQLGGTISMPARRQDIHFKTGKRGNRLQGFRKASKADEHRTVEVAAHTIHMPVRPFLGLDDDDDVEIVRIAEDFIAGQELRR